MLHMFGGVVFKMLGTHWVLPLMVAYLLFRGEIGLGRSSDVWNLTSLFLMWIVWKECNSHTFEDNEKSLEQQKSL